MIRKRRPLALEKVLEERSLRMRGFVSPFGPLNCPVIHPPLVLQTLVLPTEGGWRRKMPPLLPLAWWVQKLPPLSSMALPSMRCLLWDTVRDWAQKRTNKERDLRGMPLPSWYHKVPFFTCHLGATTVFLLIILS